MFHLHVSRSLYQFQVHGWAPRRYGVYDQMEQLFTNRKFHVAPTEIFGFFPKWKAPSGCLGSFSERGLIFRTAASNLAWSQGARRARPFLKHFL